MAENTDIWLTINTDTVKGVRVDPVRFFKALPRAVETEVTGRMRTIAERLVEEIKIGYAKAIRIMPRSQEHTLSGKLAQALTFNIYTPKDKIWMGVFDLGLMDRATRNQGRGTESRGWFMLFEAGHTDGRLRHGSRKWAFVTAEMGVHLAEKAAEAGQLPPDRKAKFIEHKREAFRGRRGEGIMVNLDEPLFFDAPWFGVGPDGIPKARNVLEWGPHRGFEEWNVLLQVGGTMRDGKYKESRDRWLVDEMSAAVEKAVRSIT